MTVVSAEPGYGYGGPSYGYRGWRWWYDRSNPDVQLRAGGDHYGHGRLWSDRSNPDLKLGEGGCDVVANPAKKINEGRLTEEKYFEVHMPGAKPTIEDDYLCSAFNLRSMTGGLGTTKLYLTGFNVTANKSRVHHVDIIKCSRACIKEGVYDCWNSDDICGTTYQQQALIFDSGRPIDAGSLSLPLDVGFEVDVMEDQIVMQVHYKLPLDIDDETGVNIKYTEEKPKYKAGMLMLRRSALTIPPGVENVTAIINCKVCALTCEISHMLGDLRYNIGQQSGVMME